MTSKLIFGFCSRSILGFLGLKNIRSSCRDQALGRAVGRLHERPMAPHRRVKGGARVKPPHPKIGRWPISHSLRPKESYLSHRSWTMAQVGSTNTTPEVAVRKAAHALGLRFRLHRADLPGKPDLVFSRWQTALFVNGCFWHSHHCERARLPKSNVEYWTKKLQRNAQRDKATLRLLRKSGWRCVVIWECQAKDPAKLSRILRRWFPASTTLIGAVRPKGRRRGPVIRHLQRAKRPPL